MEMAPAIEAFHQTAKYYPPIQERMQMTLTQTSKNRSRLASSGSGWTNKLIILNKFSIYQENNGEI